MPDIHAPETGRNLWSTESLPCFNFFSQILQLRSYGLVDDTITRELGLNVKQYLPKIIAVSAVVPEESPL